MQPKRAYFYNWGDRTEHPRRFQLTEPEPSTAATLDAPVGESRSVFPPQEIISPDNVSGQYDTLEHAVWQATGRPSLVRETRSFS